jgi:hypothetical protein
LLIQVSGYIQAEFKVAYWPGLPALITGVGMRLCSSQSLRMLLEQKKVLNVAIVGTTRV